MPFDTFHCPQTEEEVKTWFYQGINKQIDEDASDWVQVMEACGLPPGYGPGVRPHASMPYFAITQQYSSGPKARIFLPTDRPDGNNYYTRCIQYLKDAPGQTGKLLWSWDWIAGHEYVPVEGADSSQPSNGDTVTRAQLEEILRDYFKVDDKVALEMNSGKIMGVVSGGPSADGQPVGLVAKTDAHAWESFKMRRGE